MKRNILKLLGVAFFVNLLLVGCTSKFDDINTNPDAAKTVPPTNILAFSIRYYMNSMYDAWNNMNEPETYGGHLAKIQYIDEARYVYRPGTVENKWYYIYITVQNLRNMQAMAAAEGNTNLQAVGLVLEAFMMQEATDTWRDIPYSDAFKLSDGVTNPKYDTQETIYPALIATLQQASELFKQNKGTLGAGDVLFKGNVAKWQKFANSMILRLAIRISKVGSSVAQPALEKVMSDLSNYPILDSNSDNVFFIWDTATPYQEPWFVDAKTRDDHAVSDVLVNTLQGLNDPRLPVYALPATGTGLYTGFKIGAAAQPNLTTVSRIGKRFRNVAAGFSPLMRSSEVWFFIAEASMLGWKTNVAAKDAYEKAVTLSMQENGVAADDITTYLAGSGKFVDTYDQIYLQEWIALFKQGMEAWSLYRRTGVPQLYHAEGSKYSGHNVPPFRYPYPTTETNLNGTNSKPHVDKVKDDFWGQQMWWDTRTGVQ
jgi:hypothetical protein